MKRGRRSRQRREQLGGVQTAARLRTAQRVRDVADTAEGRRAEAADQHMGVFSLLQELFDLIKTVLRFDGKRHLPRFFDRGLLRKHM